MSRKKRGQAPPLGRRTRLLDPGVHEQLVAQTRMGAPVELAAAAAGVPERTFYDWLARGRAEDERLTDYRGDVAPEPDPIEAPYLELLREVLEARATAAVRNVQNIQRAAQGGFITEKSTKKYRDPETGALVEETTEKRSAPDWKAAAWYLERQQRSHFGRDTTQVEVTGAGGGPIEVHVDANDLASKVATNIAVLTAAATPELTTGHEDVVDAETVDPLRPRP